jgi:hypothetical protein
VGDPGGLTGLTVKYTDFCAKPAPFAWSDAVIPLDSLELYVAFAKDGLRESVVGAVVILMSLPCVETLEYVVPLTVPPANEALTL